MQGKINVDTVGMLLTLQAMAHFALWGASKVDGTLALIGYGLATGCFLLLAFLLVLSLKHQPEPRDRKC